MAHPRAGHKADLKWSWAEEEALRWCANRRGRGAAEVQTLFMPWRTLPAILLKASRMRVRLHKRGGAPAGNRNGARTWYAARD
jgi:hypothetical protein